MWGIALVAVGGLLVVLGALVVDTIFSISAAVTEATDEVVLDEGVILILAGLLLFTLPGSAIIVYYRSRRRRK